MSSSQDSQLQLQIPYFQIRSRSQVVGCGCIFWGGHLWCGYWLGKQPQAPDGPGLECPSPAQPQWLRDAPLPQAHPTPSRAGPVQPQLWGNRVGWEGLFYNVQDRWSSAVPGSPRRGRHSLPSWERIPASRPTVTLTGHWTETLTRAGLCLLPLPRNLCLVQPRGTPPRAQSPRMLAHPDQTPLPPRPQILTSVTFSFLLLESFNFFYYLSKTFPLLKI